MRSKVVSSPSPSGRREGDEGQFFWHGLCSAYPIQSGQQLANNK